MKRFVAIDLKLMKENELSFIKWVLLENIHFLSNNSQNSCYASKESLGKHLGITRRQVFTIIEGLVKSGYLIKVGKNNLQVTDKWLNLASTDAKESRCEKSSYSMKKVHSEDEPTMKKLPNESMKKVHTKEEISIKNNIKKNIINNIPKKREKLPLSLSRQTKFTNLTDNYLKELKEKIDEFNGALSYEDFVSGIMANEQKYQYTNYLSAYKNWNKKRIEDNQIKKYKIRAPTKDEQVDRLFERLGL